MKIICISDTHALHRHIAVPDGDVLIHAGDITKRGELDILEDFNEWLGDLPHPHKFVIAGNHDFCFENQRRNAARRTMTNATYLQDQSAEVNGIKIYGTPWQPWFYDWAFNVQSIEERREIWAKIPDDTEILIVHGPPHNHGDCTTDGRRVGCKALLERIEKIEPRLVVTGHIHENYGRFQFGPTEIVNASICTYDYEPTNPAIVVDW